MKNVFILASLLLIIGVGCSSATREPIIDVATDAPIVTEVADDEVTEETTDPLDIGAWERFDFSELDATYRFSAQVPVAWDIAFVENISSINMYDSHDAEELAIDRSQIFIRQFRANDFLTLSTVDIVDWNDIELHGRPAASYRIRKKAGVPDFPNQPAWRNTAHDVVDIRFQSNSPSVFYVFAYDPTLDSEVFERFIASIQFHNDESSFRAPMDRFAQRITKKPFGIDIDPATSPVQPERFSGFHNAVDLEVFPNEIDAEVEVGAFCGGDILQVRRVTGYGGLVVQECELENQKLAIIYGHMDIESIHPVVGEYIAPGAHLGYLGDHESAETDGERKHLHFGIYRGAGIDIRGYVPTETQLEGWLDPAQFLTINPAKQIPALRN